MMDDGPPVSPALTRQLERALRHLRYGTVQLVVHDAQIVRIERVERIRLTDTSEALTLDTDRPTDTPEAGQDIHAER